MAATAKRALKVLGVMALLGVMAPGTASSAIAAPSAIEAEAEALLNANQPASNLDRAIALLEKAVSEGSLTAVHKLAMALDERAATGDLKQARELLLHYRSDFETAYRGDDTEMATYLRAIAFVSFHAGLSKEALAAARQARSHVVALGKYSLWVAQIDMEIGNYLEDLGQYDEALASMRQALAVIEKGHGKNHPRTGAVHQNMGNVYESQSDYGTALKEYQEALRVALKNDGPRSVNVAQLYDNIGGVLDRLGQSEEGLAYFTRATPILSAALGEGHPAMGRHLADLATIYSALQRYPEALDHYDRALPLLIKGFGEDSKFVATVLFNRANAISQLGRNADALKAYREASTAMAAIYGADSVNTAMVEVEMAGAMMDLGQSSQALELYTKALKVYRQAFGENNYRTGLLYNAIGIANTNLKDYGAAAAAYRQALKVRSGLFGPAHPDVAAVLSNLSRSLAESGELDGAVALLIQALAIFGTDPARNLDPLRKTYLGLADRLKSLNTRRAATIFAKLAVNAHQDLRLRNAELPLALEQSLARTMKPAYDLLVEQQISDGAFSEAQFAGTLIKSAELIAFSRGKADEAQTTSARARLTKRESKFLSELNKTLAPVTKLAAGIQKLVDRNRTKALSNKEQEKLALLKAEFEQQSAAAAQNARALFNQLETGMQAAQQDELGKSKAQASAIQKTLSALGPDVVLYQAIALDDRLHLFISAAGHDTIHREVAVTRPELARKVYDAVNAVEARNAQAPARLQDLHAVLFAPVAADVAAMKPSVVMLDLAGFLRYVPYAALNSGQRYLIEDYALALYTPAVPARFIAPDRTAAHGAGFGVSLGIRGFAPLPGAGRELEDIFSGADRVGPLDGKPYLDGEFSAASFKTALKQKPQYLHIASHFKFEPGNETRSYLLLGTGGTLTLADLRSGKDIDFKGIDLLTLSACETARGGGSEGEEIESFGALAQSKGASAVMATLWQIADQSTARLMTDFYEGLITGGLDKARALQRAQLAMLKGVPAVSLARRGVTAADEEFAALEVSSTSHPYYWSAFILMGNWK